MSSVTVGKNAEWSRPWQSRCPCIEKKTEELKAHRKGLKYHDIKSHKLAGKL